MDTIGLGLITAFQLQNLLYCFIGVFIGTFIGVFPGIGPTAAIAMLMPATFGIPSVSAIIMLSGIYYGAMYGGSTTSILVNIPGEVGLGRYLHRWLSNGSAGKGRSCTGNMCLWVFHCGDLWSHCPRHFGPFPGQYRSRFWITRVFQSDDTGDDPSHLSRFGIHSRKLDHGWIRDHFRMYWSGYNPWKSPANLWNRGPLGWSWVCAGHHGTFWHFRSASQS